MALWITLAVFGTGLAGGLAYAAVRGIAMWRAVKRTGGALAAETDRIARVADEIARQLERASASGARLGIAGTRLRTSLARLQVQRSALAEARGALGYTFWFLPGA